MKKIFYLSFVLFSFLFLACSDSKEDELQPDTPDLATIELESDWSNFALPQDGVIIFKANITSSSPIKSYLWEINEQEVSTEKEFAYEAKELGKHSVALTIKNADGTTTTKQDFEVYGKFKHGIFVLNEGNMTSENGSLVFISPLGEVIDSAYWKVNNTELGNVTQDMAYANGDLYFISQNGDKGLGKYPSDGALIIADAETLKKKESFSLEEIGNSVNSWPSHIAVADNQIYIRGNGGIVLFDKTAKAATLIEGTKGAKKNTMVTIGSKVFAINGSKVLVLEKGSVAETVDMGASVTGLAKASDGNLWVSTANSISKVDPKDYVTIKKNDVTEVNLNAGVAATSAISAKGDTLYYSGTKTQIYRHIFSEGTTTLVADLKTMINDANIVYNTAAVHPITGHVYMTTIKGFGWDFLKNSITALDLSKAEPTVYAQYLDHTRFPVGTFFTDNFDRK